MAETLLDTPLGPVELRRGHTPVGSPLRAWSAADELMLEHIDTADPGRVLIVNDSWGALTVGLARWKPILWSDSALARAAVDQNLARNGGSPLAARAVPGDRLPPGLFDTVLVSVPKSTALLDWQCLAIAAASAEPARVLVGGMTRHLSRAVAETLEQRLGAVHWHRARRKARLLEVQIERGPQPAPRLDTSWAFTTDDGVAVHQAPGVFSAGHLDVGTALLLEVIDRVVGSAGRIRVADLGSGNGVIATTLAGRWPHASFDLADVSDLAIASARATWRANHADDARARFVVADGFGADAGPYDLIVTNPPFHQDHAEDRGLTDRLLAESAAELAADGTLVVVAQRHRELHRRMRRWFAQVDTVSAHPSHVVLVASAPRGTGG